MCGIVCAFETKNDSQLRTKVLEPIFKQQEEGEKLLDEAFEMEKSVGH